VQLRTYQGRDIAGIRSSFAGGGRRVLSRSPTGSGKTAQFSIGVAVAAARGIRAAILGHQDEIIRQTSKALDELGVTHGIIAAGYDETVNLPVQIASVALSGGDVA
jgi:DNA repair protein RadD